MPQFSSGPGEGPPQQQQSSGGDWIAALVNAGSAIYSAQVAKRNTDKTIAANKEQAKYAYSQELEAWNRQNDYNNPLNQMARLKAAGLNPNMIYGSGSGSASGNASSAQMPKYNAPNLQYNYQPINIPSILGAYQDFRMRQAQIDQVKAATQNIQQRTVNDAVTNTILQYKGKDLTSTVDAKESANLYNKMASGQASVAETMATNAQTRMSQELARLKLMTQQQQMNVLQQQYTQNKVSQQDIEADRKKAELLYQTYKNQWMAQGVTTSDSPLIRILVRMANELGFSLTDVGSLMK